MNQTKIDTAVILAAGMGNRLKPFTNNIPKCMVELNGKPLIAHTVDALESNGFENLIVVTGYRNDQIESFLIDYPTSMNIKTIYNDVYDETNNIYSLWLVSEYIQNGFTLIESDIILESSILKHFLSPDRIALDLFSSEKHYGTTATIDENLYLEKLYLKADPPENRDIYKTVNIYSFSQNTWNLLKSEMNRFIEAGEVNGFYEAAIQRLVEKGDISLQVVSFKDTWWDEIDTPDDLSRVNKSLKWQKHLLLNKELQPDFSE
ncbi:MAG: phosphocholine cytidylyltransferase family protein [Balneolaceae bacterium]|nr:MAG: phosphocholine cytidylyltransferase family protein [Balneolaceae bacterium]